ncbi:MAG: phosphodiesterase [Gammaproteobacteria bacterium]
MHQSISIAQRHADRIELLQFTDTHVYAEPGQCFDGVDTAATLADVIAHAGKFCPLPDAILLTGDLVHEPSPAAYDRLSAILCSVERPVFCIPGNHDQPELMHQILDAGNISMAKSIHFERWIIVLLNTFLPDTHAGNLGADELVFLDQILTEYKDNHALICLHHPPVSIGSPWMDRMGLQNPAALFAIVDRHPQVRGILWGHIHQEFKCERHAVKLMATPSTCLQFAPQAGSYIKDDKPPAYRHLQLYASGEIRTGVVYIHE